MAIDINNMLSKNVILIDANFIDYVAHDFSYNLKQVLNRDIPNADLALWLECIALDGGLTPGNENIQVIFIYENNIMQNFSPSDISKNIDGMAFMGNLGEFALEAYQVEKNITSIADQFADTLQVLINAEKVENLLVVPNMNIYGDKVKDSIEKSENKSISVFTITPQEGGSFTNQQLGFSILHSMGISSDDFRD